MLWGKIKNEQKKHILAIGFSLNLSHQYILSPLDGNKDQHDTGKMNLCVQFLFALNIMYKLKVNWGHIDSFHVIKYVNHVCMTSRLLILK